MGAKRALIVDDSKSARIFLARILEKYEIDVDDAENAEAAIQYLTTHRPDVIFMDHLMPGMDGFQAVQAIKSNPVTATIPILMYTSQEGELYLGQARALGAVGVLPKQIKPADVSKVLYQLHLLVDRRSAHQTSFRPVNLAANEIGADESANDSGPVSKPLTDTALREQFAELRRALVAGVDTQTERLIAEVRALLLEAQPVQSEAEEKTLEVPGQGQSPQWAWLVASFALAIALATTALWWQQSTQLRALDSEVTELRDAVVSRGGLAIVPTVTTAAPGATAARADETAKAPAGATAAKPLPTDATPLSVPVPYGAEALGGARLEVIRQLLERLVKEGRSGVVDIKSYAGRFCLIGNATEGFSLAPDETLFSKCDLIGNPLDEALLPAQRTPLPFANLAAAMRNASHGSLNVQSSQGDPNTTAQPYPTPSGELTAGDWNRVAAANNRIEIRVR